MHITTELLNKKKGNIDNLEYLSVLLNTEHVRNVDIVTCPH